MRENLTETKAQLKSDLETEIELEMSFIEISQQKIDEKVTFFFPP